MSPWQVLRAGRATQAALGHHVHHVPGGLVHYSAAPADAAAVLAPDGSRSFCLSREKVTLQQLNSRLAMYLQQVQHLEATNQHLEREIQRELNRKCPRELMELERHLRTVSLLQEQISNCLSAQAQMKLQLLSAELTVFDLSARYEKECERRGALEVELSNLRLLDEELQVHRLPELHNLLNDQTQQLTELQMQHEQDMQGVLDQTSGGVSVEMHPVESLDLIQQMYNLRQTGVTLPDKNLNECWFGNQVSMLSSPEVTFEPPEESEVIQAELQELRTTAVSLEEDLRELQTQNMVLEASGLEQNQSFVQQLVILQQTADSLCADLDSVLQTAAQQAAQHQTLLDIKTRLEAEIQEYRRLLDGLSSQGVSGLRPMSAANFTSFCVTPNLTVQEGSLRMMEAQAVPVGHIHTPIAYPLSEMVTTVQSTRFHDKHSRNSPITSIWMDSFVKSENQGTEAFPETVRREPISATISQQNIFVEDKVHTEDDDLQNSSVVIAQVRHSLDKETAAQESNRESGSFTFKQTTTEADRLNKTATNIQTEITKSIIFAEQDVKQRPHFITHTTRTEPSIQTSAEAKKVTESVVSDQMNCVESSNQAENQDPAQVEPLSLEIQAKAQGIITLVSDIQPVCIQPTQKSTYLTDCGKTLSSSKSEEPVSPEEVHVFSYEISRPTRRTSQGLGHLLSSLVDLDLGGQDHQSIITDKEEQLSLGSQHIASKYTGDTAYNKDVQQPGGSAGGFTESHVSGSHILRSEEAQETRDQRSALSQVSNSGQNKVMEGAVMGSVTADGILDSSNNLESKAAQGIISSVSDIQPARSAAGQANPESFNSKQTVTEADKTQTNIQTVITTTFLRTAEPQVKVSSVSEKGAEVAVEAEGTVPGHRSDQNLLLSNASNNKQFKLMGDAVTKNMKRVELEMHNGRTVNSLHDTNEINVDLNGLDSKTINQTSQDVLMRTAESKKSTYLTDCGKTLSSSKSEEPVSPEEVHVFSYEISRPTRRTSQGLGHLLSSLVDLDLGGQDHQSIITDKEEQLSLGSQHIASKYTGDTAYNKDVQQSGGSAGGFTESHVSGSHFLMSEEAQETVSGDLIHDRDIERQKKKEEVEVTLPALRLDQRSALSQVSNSEQNKVMEGAVMGSVTADGILDSSDNLESKAAQGIISSVSDIQPARSAAGQANPESFNSKQTVTEADKTQTNIQTVITTTFLRTAEPQVKVSDVLNFNDDRELERQAKKGAEVAVEAEGTVPGHRSDQSLLLSNASNNKQFKLMGDAVTGSDIPTTSTASPDSNGNKLNDAAITKNMKRVELEMHNGKTVNSLHDTNEINVDLNGLDSKTINQTSQDVLLRTAESKKSTYLTDCGKTLSSSKSEEPVSPEEVHVFSYEISRPTRRTSQGLGHLLSSLVDLDLGGQDHQSIITDKEEQLSLGSQHIASKYTGDTAYNKDVQQSGGSAGGSCGSNGQKETLSTEDEVKGQKNDDQLVANMPENSKGALNECVKSTSINTIPPNEGTTFSGVTSDSGVMATSNSSFASDLTAGSGSTAANTSGTVGSNAEADTTAGVQGRFRRDSGEWMVYGGSMGHKTNTRSKVNLTGAEPHAANQQDTQKLSISKSGKQRDGCSLDDSTSLPSEGKEESPSAATKPETSPQEKGRFSGRGSGEWIAYSGSLGRKKTLPRTRSEEIPSATMPPETRRVSSVESEEWVVCSGSLKHSSLTGSDGLLDKNRKENRPTSPAGGGRFGSRGSGEWRVYGGSTGRISISASSNNLPSTDKEESMVVKQQTSPSGSLETGRFANGGSGEWRVYGGSTGRLSRASSADRVSVSASSNRHTTGEPKLSSAGSAGKLTSGSVVKRSCSVGSGGRLSSSGSGGRLSGSSGSYRTSTSGKYSSTASTEWKPVYSSASARKSSLGSIGRSGGGGKISSQKAQSPGGRMHVSMGSLGWLTSSAAGGISSSGSGSKLSSADSSDKISSRTGGRISSSSGSGRTNSTGGRVISSSDWPVRSTGSATGGNKERISVCKMAALSISAAGRERSQDKQRQQKQAADSSALMQRWLDTDVRVNSTKPGGHGNLTHL